jgi:hypothetical protein
MLVYQKYPHVSTKYHKNKLPIMQHGQRVDLRIKNSKLKNPCHEQNSAK